MNGIANAERANNTFRIVATAKLLILQLGHSKVRPIKKSDSFYSNFESKSLRKEVDGRSQAHLESSLNVGKLQSSRYVLLHVLLLCMCVLWRGEAADLRILS